MLIDNSQYTAYAKCPAYWVERYVRGVHRLRTEPVDDALTLGSLVHDGLARAALWRDPVPSKERAEAMNAAESCYDLACRLVYNYIRSGGNKLFGEMESVEQVLKFWLKSDSPHQGMAKVDLVQRVAHLANVQAASTGGQLIVPTGVYSVEHKTKALQTDRATYMQAWQANTQASFQLLALQERYPEDPVGLIVNVLEKPRQAEPKRKCKKCTQYYALSMWRPVKAADAKQFACPFCANEQKIQPDKTKPFAYPWFRFLVTRSQERLEFDRRQIAKKAADMHRWFLNRGVDGVKHALIKGDLWSPHFEWSACLPWNSRTPCTYFEAHTQLVDPLDTSGFVQDPHPLAYLEL